MDFSAFRLSAPVIGYCRGWNLLDEIDYSVPVIKSDWVVADRGGAVYVLAHGVDVLNANGQDQAKGFSVYEPGTDHLVEVTGVVRLSSDAHGHIEPPQRFAYSSRAIARITLPNEARVARYEKSGIIEVARFP